MLQCNSRHVVRLETRPANVEGKRVSQREDLVKKHLEYAALTPPRIIVGEVAAAKCSTCLQKGGAMSTLRS